MGDAGTRDEGERFDRLRREILRVLGASALAGSFTACFGPISEADARLASRPSGPQVYGAQGLPTHFSSYRDLARLPFFEADRAGSLRCVVDDAQGAIDFHTHLGLSYFLAGDLDLQRRTQGVSYIFDCSGADTPCLLNLNIYQNRMASQEILDELRWDLIRAGLPGGSPTAETHTIPNLLAEMDAMGLERAVILSIALRLPFDANPSQEWIEAARGSRAPERLVVFGSVHPEDDDALQTLRALKTMGAAGVKIHPPMQRVLPDSDAAMAVFQECDRLGLPVLFHAGRAGIEPEAAQAYAQMKHYWEPIKSFPNLRFVLGHAGCRLDADEARALAKEQKNVWLEISGQGLDQLETMKAEIDGERILYGTDWPFYPLAPALAKVCMITEGDRALRRRILRDNALAFLEQA